MRRRLLDLLAPVRPVAPDRGYRRLLRWGALPVTDRRWAAPLAAIALGFGLFAGVAIGPGTAGTLATGGPQVIELPGLLASDGEAEAGPEAEPAGLAAAGSGSEAAASESGLPELESSFPEAAVEPEPAEPPAAEPAPGSEPESEHETEPEPEAQVVAGVVVHANPAAGSYTVAENGGAMNAIHAAKLPAAGARVSVPVRTLANGTFAEAGQRKQSGSRAGAALAGIVTFVDPDPAAPAYAVSKRGVSVLVRVHPDPAGAVPPLPRLGAYASVTVAIEGPASVPLPADPEPSAAAEPAAAPAPACAPDPAAPPAPPAATEVLWQRQLDADGAPFASSDFEGVVTALCPAEAKLLLSGDDLRQSGKDIAFAVPASLDLGGLEVGDSVAVTAAIAADGTLSLTGLASDERVKGADDAASAQGDLAPQALK